MTFFVKIAPELIPIKDERGDLGCESGDDDLPNHKSDWRFPYKLDPYVSVARDALSNRLIPKSWGWRAKTVAYTALSLLSVPFYVIEMAIAAIGTLFALVQTREPQNRKVCHLFLWAGESFAGGALAFASPVVAVSMFCLGRVAERFFPSRDLLSR